LKSNLNFILFFHESLSSTVESTLGFIIWGLCSGKFSSDSFNFSL
jgi:hypothetical protein